jgi:hypothetical protein
VSVESRKQHPPMVPRAGRTVSLVPKAVEVPRTLQYHPEALDIDSKTQVS